MITDDNIRSNSAIKSTCVFVSFLLRLPQPNHLYDNGLILPPKRNFTENPK